MSNHEQLAAEQSAASFDGGVPGETIAAVGPLEKRWLSQNPAEKRDKFDEAADQKPAGVAANGSSSSSSCLPESGGNSSAKKSHDADRTDASQSGGSDGRSNRQLDFERRGYKRRRAGKNVAYYVYWSCPRAGRG